MGKVKDISNERYGRLIVVSFAGIRKHRAMWACKCDCGREVTVASDNLQSGTTQSCGCIRKEKHKETHYKHGRTPKRLYNIWNGMRQRCEDRNHHKFRIYGGRGISVCDEWSGENGFIAFREWALTHGYSENLSIDRIDVNGNYEPQNCRWATAKEQALNTRFNKYYDGLGTSKRASEWAEYFGINRTTFYRRLRRGLTIDDMAKI